LSALLDSVAYFISVMHTKGRFGMAWRPSDKTRKLLGLLSVPAQSGTHRPRLFLAARKIRQKLSE